MSTPTEVTITVTLSDEQAEAFAQFLKRVGFSDYRSLAVDDAETYAMRSAGEAIRKGLDEQGYSPR
jgi:hypothetical protein